MVVYVMPFAFHKYDPVAVIVDVDELLCLIVKFNVRVLSQPAELVKLAVFTPEVVYVKPLTGHVYELQADTVCGVFTLAELMIITIAFEVAVDVLTQFAFDVITHVTD